MSYVSGFMMGAAIGKGLRQMMTGGGMAPSAPGGVRGGRPVRPRRKPVRAGFELVASQPGRRRYRAGAMGAELAALLEEKLARLAFVRSVKANALSGSILILFDEAAAAQMDKVAETLRTRVFAAAGNGERRMDGGMPSEAHAGSVTRTIRGSMRAFSAWIKRNTCGWFDVSSLASLLFLLRGIRKMILTKQYPSGSQMLWWAVSLMRGWRTV